MKKIALLVVLIMSVVLTGSIYSDTQESQQEKEKIEKEKQDKEKQEKEKAEKERVEKEKKDKEEKEKLEKEGLKKEEPKKEDPKKTDDKIIIKKKNIGEGKSNSVITDKSSGVKKNKEKKKSEDTDYEEEMEYESDGSLVPLSEGFSSSSTGRLNSYGAFNLDLKYQLTFAAKYSLLGTYHSSSLTSIYFTDQWKSDMLFTGVGGEISFALLGLIDRNIGLTLSLGYYEHRTVTNSFNSGIYSIVENSQLNSAVFKIGVINYLRDWFYIKGGVTSYSYNINTNVSTNMPGYTYVGLEGSTHDSALYAGSGITLEIFKGFTLNLDAEITVFVYDKEKVKGLRAGLMPSAGVTFVW